MQVSQIMTKKLVTVECEDSVESAIKLLRRRGVRHLLVMDGSRLAGILSDRDIKRALDPSKMRMRVQSMGGFFFMLDPIQVEEIMTHAPVTISPGTPIHEAARTMLDRKFGALPVVDRKRVVGIVTETDVLRHFMNREAKQNQKAERSEAKRRTRPTKSRRH